MEIVKVRLIKMTEPSNLLDAEIRYYSDADDWFIEFKSSIFEGVFQDGDIFSCLCELRKSLEKIGWNIMCNGARINSWATTMSRQMGGGFKIYLLTINEEMDRKKLVRIFDEASAQEIGTVDQQFDFYKKWLKSVGRGL
jgi:hypothetical protein